MSATSASAVPYYFCNLFMLYTIDFNIRNVKVECRPRFLRFEKLENNLKSYISGTATNTRPLLEDIRLNLQHTLIIKFRVLSLLCVHWYGRPHFSTFGAGRILV